MRRCQPLCMRAAVWEVGKYRSEYEVLTGRQRRLLSAALSQKRQKETDDAMWSASFCLFDPDILGGVFG